MVGAYLRWALIRGWALKRINTVFIQMSSIKAGVNVKAALTSLNTAFLPISRSHFKRR